MAHDAFCDTRVHAEERGGLQPHSPLTTPEPTGNRRPQTTSASRSDGFGRPSEEPVPKAVGEESKRNYANRDSGHNNGRDDHESP